MFVVCRFSGPFLVIFAMELRFDGKVAVVTGAGRGLGREYALFLASRGAKVVINDFGKSLVGEGQAETVAESVVKEITSKGGVAVADMNSVIEGDKIIKTAMDAFGRVDILINNAGVSVLGILPKQDDKGWQLTMDSHVFGAYKCTRAAWDIMRSQGYGRIVNITSIAGLHGDHGMTSYSAAKSAIIGFTQSLAIEGAKRNIIANAVAPLADTRMLAALHLNKKLVDLLKPQFCVPLIGVLCHESCKETGGIFECGGGWFSKVRWERAEGVRFDPEKLTTEAIAQNFSKITSFSGKNEYPKFIPDWSKKVNEWMTKSKL